MSVIEGEQLPRSHYSEVGTGLWLLSSLHDQVHGNVLAADGELQGSVSRWARRRGSITFTWYRPTLPGVKPLKMNPAVLPPMVTVGVQWC